MGALVLSACGGSSEPGPGGTTASEPDTPQSFELDDDDRDVMPAVAPARAAAIRRRLDALVAAYKPVSARINFLVSAETLRKDAVGSGAGEAIELERTGAVRVELRRMRSVLGDARSAIADVQVGSDVQQRIQRLLLQAVDFRLRSLGQLEAALDGLAGEVGDSEIDARFEAWEESWDASLRAAREATTALQDERARVGLDPAPEESFR